MEWSDELYFKFLEALHTYFYDPINNKKIAKSMGHSVEANHVR